MKRITSIFIFLGFLTIVQGQDFNKKIFINGALGFDFTSSSTAINTTNYSNPNANQSYNVNIASGYYITDKLAPGLQLCYGFTSSHYLDYVYRNKFDSLYGFTNTSKTFCIAPLLRYNIRISDKLCFNINITVPYSYTKNKDGSNIFRTAGSSTGYISLPPTLTSVSYGLNINPSLQWFVKDNFAIIGSLGALSYNHTKMNSSENTNKQATTAQSNNLRLSLSSGMCVGVLFYFGGNKQ